MRRTATLAVLALALGVTTLAAQNPPPPADGPGFGAEPGGPPPGEPGGPPPGGPAMHGADFLLGHTGELKLTDQQVVRLAAIARRSAERREAQRPQPPAPGQRPSDADMARMRQHFDQMREQSRTDLRDALAVLTADQQARAWEMISHGPGGPDGRGGPGRPGGRGGPGGMHPGGPGAPPPPPMDGRAPRNDDAPPPPRPQD
jgi:hypothetical protein